MSTSRASHTKLTESGSTRRLMEAFPINPKPLVCPHSQVIESSVAANFNNKLHGTFGETIVVFHPADSQLGEWIRAIQHELKQIFRTLHPSLAHQYFITNDGHHGYGTDFAPIENPHTTIIAMRVIDSNDRASWDKRLIQSYLIAKAQQYHHITHENIKADLDILFNQDDLTKIIAHIGESRIRKWLQIDDHTHLRNHILCHAHDSLHDQSIEQTITNLITQHPTLMLELDSIALAPNGSLGIRWKENNDLIQLREAFVDIGGIAKHGNEVINTTLGYFPFCTPEIAKSILMKLSSIESTIASKLPSNRQFQLPLQEAELVKFSRNDLHKDYIREVKLLINNQLNISFEQTIAFPEELLCVTTH